MCQFERNLVWGQFAASRPCRFARRSAPQLRNAKAPSRGVVMCASIAALWLVLFASSVALGQQPLDRRPSITAVERIEMTVGDMDRSLRFFTDVLECEVIRDVTAMIPGERELVQVANTRISSRFEAG